MGLFLSKKDVQKIIREDVQKIIREELEAQLQTIHTKLNKILMNTAELKVALDAATTQVTKIQAEQTARFDKQSMLITEQATEIQRLTDLLNAGGEVSPEVAASLAALQTNLDAFDATIPDAPENPA